METFCRQTQEDDFSRYTANIILDARKDNDRRLCDRLGVSAATLEKTHLEIQKRMFDGNTVQFELVLRVVVERAFKLQRSEWHPSHPITSLMEQLRQHGPHVVCGKLGKLYYEADPIRLSGNVAGRPLFGWQPGTGMKPEGNTHAVVVVGAKSDQELVYFIDPMDGSDPADPQTQKIYVMSYKAFRNRLCDLFSNMLFKEDAATGLREPVFIQGNPFALHAPAHTLASHASALSLESKTKQDEN
jgi:hypothetical protein